MGFETGLKLGQKVITAWTKTGASNSLIAMKPVKVNIEGLKLAPKLESDVATFSAISINKPLFNSVTGQQIATNIFQLPEKEGWITLLHRTHSDNISGIMKDGLWYSESGEILSTSSQMTKKEIIDEISSGIERPHGNIYMIFQMPEEEFKLLTSKLHNGEIVSGSHYIDNLGYAFKQNFNFANNTRKELVIPPYYLVGCIDRIKMLNMIKQRGRNVDIPHVQIPNKKTDISQIKLDIEKINDQEFEQEMKAWRDHAELLSKSTSLKHSDDWINNFFIIQ